MTILTGAPFQERPQRPINLLLLLGILILKGKLLTRAVEKTIQIQFKYMGIMIFLQEQ